MRFSASLLCLAICCAGMAYGGGFQVNLQGIKQNGLAHAGTGWASDASVVFLNPGAMPFLPGKLTINGGVNLVMPYVGYQEPDPGFYTAFNNNHLSTPLLLYASYRLRERWALGLAVNNPFGSSIDWDDDWAGQYVIRHLSLTTFSLQPTVACRITDKVGIGIGGALYYGSLELARGIPTASEESLSGAAELTGSALAGGANAGIFINLRENLTAGISYRSPVKITLDDGTAEFTVPSALQDSFPMTSFRSSITLPQVITAGITWRFKDRWMLAAEVDYTGWYSYDCLKFDYKNNTEQLEDTRIAKSFKGTFTVRTGLQYAASEVIDLRAGIYYDMTPVKDGFLSPESPYADAIGLSGGGSVSLSQRFSLDASFIYVHGFKRKGGSDAAGFYGTYKTRAFIPSIGFQFEWQ